MKRFLPLFLFSFIINLSFGQIEYNIVQGDATICDWSNAIIDIQSDADEISWTPSDSLSCDDCFHLTANPRVTTTYTATLKKKQEGDETFQITITVKPNDAHFPQGDTLYFCKGDSKNVLLEMENTAGDVHWTSSEGLDSILMNETMVDTFLTPLDNMVFYASAANTADCTDSIVIQVDSLPSDRTIKVVNPKMPPYCKGQKIYLQSPFYEQSHFPNIQFLWTPHVEPNDGTPDTSLYNLVWTAHEPGNYTYVRETTNGACKVTDKIDVIVLNTMEVMIDPVNLKGCIGDTVQIQVKAIEEGDTAGTPLTGLTYEWKPMGADFSCVDCANPIATLTGNGNTKLKVTKTGYCPGQGTFESILDMEPVPVDIKVGFQPCAGGIADLSIANPEVGAVYTWTVTNGEIVGCTDCLSTKIKINDSPASVTVMATDADYCIDGMVTIPLAPSTNPISFEINDVAVSCPGAVVNVSIKNPMDGIVYNWFATDGEIVGCNPCVETQVRTSKVTPTKLTVKASSSSCADGMADKIIVGKESPDYLPKVFTPNSDGKNDYFNFKKSDDFDITTDQIVRFQVFNRWGQKVYDNDVPDKGWDGKINGKPASQDVYLYQVELGDNFCNEVLKGDVTLLR